MSDHLKTTVFTVIFLAWTTGKFQSVFAGSSKYDYDPIKTSPSTDRMRNPVIEIALFYDIQFEAMFGSQHNKIHKYWEVILYDLHLRYQTLPNLYTSFHVTSLTPYTEEQYTPFDFSRSCKNGDSFITTKEEVEKLYQNFQKWVYNQADKLPSFDIAVLALGTYYSGECFVRTQPLLGSICNAKNDVEKKWMASAIISFQTLDARLQSPAEILAKQIAIILGASENNRLLVAKDGTCLPQLIKANFCCIMTSNPFFPWPKFFAKCTDAEITQKLVQLISDNQFCLDAKTSHCDSVIDSAKLDEYPHLLLAYSYAEQCRLLLQIDSIIVTTVTECLLVVCMNGFTNRVVSFVPIEGSKCGMNDNGRCFRGMCMQQEVQLVNVGTGKCLVSEKGIFDVNDKPILQECSQVVTQALRLTIPEITKFDKNKTLVIEFPYARRDSIVGKRLSMIRNQSRMVFCSKEVSKVCWDDFLEIQKLNSVNGQEFLLKVKNTGLYLHAAEDEVNIDLISDGSGFDKTARWKRVDLRKEAEVPHNDSGKKCPTLEISFVLNHQESTSERKRNTELAVLAFWLAKIIY